MFAPSRLASPTHRRLIAGLVAVAFFAGRSTACAAPAEGDLKAGAFAADITPLKFPISVNGGMSDRQATGAHDRLHARAVVLDNGQTSIAIVVCDSCMIPRPVLDEAKRLATAATGIKTEQILVSATHTHTAPTAGGVFQSDPDPEYLTYLSEQIAKAIQQAQKNLEPARIGWGVGEDKTQVFNRRWKQKPGTVPPDPFGKTTDVVKTNPGYATANANLVEQAGTVDPEVSVVSIQSRDGRPIALLANYSLHYVGGVEPLSADYFGEFARRIEKLLQAENVRPAFVGIMSNGTSGDVNNVNFSGSPPPRRANFEQIEIVAESVAKAAYATVQKIEYRARVPLAAREREIELGVRKPTSAEVAEAKQILERAAGRALKGTNEIYARETVLLAEFPDTVRARLQAYRIGDLGIATTPCETFTETGLAIKRFSPLKPTFTIELANGYNGYLPPPGQHALGGYETWRARSSYLAVDAEPKILATLKELLTEVAK